MGKFLKNPFQNDSKFIGLGGRDYFNAQNACSSFQKFNKDQPKAGKHCNVNYKINLEPRSVKEGNDCSLTTGSGAIAPLSVVETVDPLDEDYDLLRRKKEELLKIQQNVKNSLETISSKINQTLPSDSDPKEHRRNHAFAVSKPSVKMMKSKYAKASQNLSRNSNKIHNCLKNTHSTNQSNLRGRKGKKKAPRKLENQTFEEEREKHCLKKISEYTNHAMRRDNTDPKKAINIMKSFE